MTDTNQLPEPELGYIKTDKSNQPAFSARQMREAMRHALRPERVPMTDEEIEALFGKCGGHWNGDQWVIEDADLHPFTRAILALRPAVEPMTPDHIWANNGIMSANGIIGFKFDAVIRIVRAVEAHHGIKAKAEGGAKP